jgi:hypothetical protein
MYEDYEQQVAENTEARGWGVFQSNIQAYGY